LLALAEAGRADYLVTGDKGGLLVFASHKSTRIIWKIRGTLRMRSHIFVLRPTTKFFESNLMGWRCDFGQSNVAAGLAGDPNLSAKFRHWLAS
jgi:hypothetical protein